MTTPTDLGASGALPGTGSYRDLIDRDPSAFHRALLDHARPVWDEGMGSWLVASHADCSRILKNEDLFAAPFAQLGFGEFFGPRALFLLTGDRHRRLYTVVRRMFTPAAVEQYRTAFIRPLVDERIALLHCAGGDGVREGGRGGGPRAGRADLADDLADQVPIRVIAGILGLDWRDGHLARQCLEWTAAYQAHTAHYMLPDGRADEVRAAAEDGMRRLDDVLTGAVERQWESADGGYIAQVTEHGRRLFPDWGIADTVDQARFLYVAGMHTTSALVCNALHTVLTDTAWAERLRTAGDGELAAFAEEVVRLTPSLQMRVRIATRDTELSGTVVRAGQQVIPIAAAANRCPAVFPAPDGVDLRRANPHSHLSFNAGPRFCGGSGLARAEAVECLRAVLTRLPGAALDPAAPPPVFRGFVQRSWRPLHVTFGFDTDQERI